MKTTPRLKISSLCRVDKDNFSDVLKGQNLSLQLNVANRLSENAAEDEQLPITMRFQSLRDFEPDAIVESGS